MSSILIFIFGLIIGSFLNMLIYRLPLSISLINPKRSICPDCKSEIKWYDNIPFVSYILLRGKCRNCAKPISLAYPAVEIITAIITLALFVKIGFGTKLVLFLLFSYTLIILSFIDLKFKAVPDYLLIILLILSLLIPGSSFVRALEFAGAIVLLELFVTFYIQNIKAKITKDDSLKDQRALGEGDIPVVAAFGAILGLKAGIAAIFLGALFAIIPSVYAMAVKKDIETPFIPYLGMGFFTEYFFSLSNLIG